MLEFSTYSTSFSLFLSATRQKKLNQCLEKKHDRAGKEEERAMFQQMQAMAQKQVSEKKFIQWAAMIWTKRRKNDKESLFNHKKLKEKELPLIA